MPFLNPTYLWALLGLLVPIAIHLWSKKEGKTIKIGSIKLLQSADSKQSSSIQINEYVLLALRLAVITILVVLIAGPQFKKKTTTVPLAYFIEPALVHQTRIGPLLDSLKATAPIYLLQEGFPEIDKYTEKTTTMPSYWHLAQQLENMAADSIVLFTRGLLQGLKGKRPKTHKNITWIFFGDAPINQYVEAVQVNDSVQLLNLTSYDQQLSFSKEELPLDDPNLILNASRDSIQVLKKNHSTLLGQGQHTIPMTIGTRKQEQLPLLKPDAIEIGMIVDDTLISQSKYIKAAFRALGTYLNRPIVIENIENTAEISSLSFDCLVWLSGQPMVKTTKSVLRYHHNPFATELIEKGASNTVFHLTAPLNSENSIDEHLVEQLLPLLDIHPGLETRIAPYDTRVSSKASLLPIYEKREKQQSKTTVKDLSIWLWSLLCILLVVERIVARYRKQ